MRAVRKRQLEGIVAKRAGSPYRSGEHAADWMKWPANRGQEFVIGGFVPNGDVLDSLLVGYYEGRDLVFAASVRAGFSPEFRRVLLPHFEKLQVAAGSIHLLWLESSFWNGHLTIDYVTRASPDSAVTKMPAT